MPGLVTAYRKSDGARVQIPEHWLTHPELGVPYSRTEVTAPVPAPMVPDESRTVPQLRAHAERNGIDLTGATTKAEVLSAVTTPAAGDNKE